MLIGPRNRPNLPLLGFNRPIFLYWALTSPISPYRANNILILLGRFYPKSALFFFSQWVDFSGKIGPFLCLSGLFSLMGPIISYKNDPFLHHFLSPRNSSSSFSLFVLIFFFPSSVFFVWTGLQRRRWIWHDSWGEVSEKLHRLGLAAIAAILAAAEIVMLLISSSPPRDLFLNRDSWRRWIGRDFREISEPIRYVITDLVRRFPTALIFHKFQEISTETYSTASEPPPATIYLEIKEVEVGFLFFFLRSWQTFPLPLFNRHLKPTFNRNAQVLSGESAGKEEEEDDLRLRVRRQRSFRRSKNRMINIRWTRNFPTSILPFGEEGEERRGSAPPPFASGWFTKKKVKEGLTERFLFLFIFKNNTNSVCSKLCKISIVKFPSSSPMIVSTN